MLAAFVSHFSNSVNTGSKWPIISMDWRGKGTVRKGQPHSNQKHLPINKAQKIGKEGRRLSFYQQDVCVSILPFHLSCPPSDESVTWQTDFSLKHSLVPAIHSHLRSQSPEFEAQQPVVMEMNVRSQGLHSKTSLAGRKERNEMCKKLN